MKLKIDLELLIQVLDFVGVFLNSMKENHNKNHDNRNENVEITIEELGTAPWDNISRKRKRGEEKKNHVEELENELYPEQEQMKIGDTVIIYEGFNDLYLSRLSIGGYFQNRYGHYAHEDIIGKPFGSRIRSSKGVLGFIHVLKPTPELWSISLGKRTQIIYPPDQSYIIFNLKLKPGSVVIESGTGSGAMSYAILRTIAPTGHLHTFEFNEHRAVTAREDFEKLGLNNLVTVTHKDVCGKLEGAEGGFGDNLTNKADAVFLDLPEPWLAIQHAKNALKYDGSFCSYSPCIEQTMRVCEKLNELNFHSICTVEVRIQNIEARENRFEHIPFTRQEYNELESIIKAKKKAKKDCFSSNRKSSESGQIKNFIVDSKLSPNTNGSNEKYIVKKETMNDETSVDGKQKRSYTNYCQANGVDEDLYSKFNESIKTYHERSASLRTCGRSKQEMRGHSAFLTFAVKHR